MHPHHILVLLTVACLCCGAFGQYGIDLSTIDWARCNSLLIYTGINCRAPPTPPLNGVSGDCANRQQRMDCVAFCRAGFVATGGLADIGAVVSKCGATTSGQWAAWSGACVPSACLGNPPDVVFPGTNFSTAAFSGCGINGSTPLNRTCEGTCTTGSPGTPTARCDLNTTTGAAVWTVDVSQCRPGCVGNPPLLPFPGGFNGLFTSCGTFSPLNATCTGACTNGVGTARAVCLPAVGGGAAWASLSANCTAVPPGPSVCASKPPGSPGDFLPWPDSCDNVTAGFTCTRNCSTFYDNYVNPASGPPAVVCQSNGTWSQNNNTCELISVCASKPSVDPGDSLPWPDSCNNVTAGFTCTRNCSTLYANAPGGPPAVVCLSYGIWSQNNNTCVFVGSNGGRKRRRLADAGVDGGGNEPPLDDADGSLHRTLLMSTIAVPQTLDIRPMLAVPGGSLVIAPITIKDVDGDKTPAELAACLSAALVTLQEPHLLNVLPTGQELQQHMDAKVQQHMEAGNLSLEHARSRVAAMAAAHAAAVAEDDPTAAEVLKLLLGSGKLYLSPMHVSSKALKLQTLKDDLSHHFDSLARLPRCISAPYSLRQALERAIQPGPVGLDVSLHLTSVEQARHPELCEGVEGLRFTARFLTSMDKVAQAQHREPETSMWAFAGSAPGDGCEKKNKAW